MRFSLLLKGALTIFFSVLSCISAVPRSCNDWWSLGYRQDALYEINPDGTCPFKVHCYLSKNPVETQIHHNQENTVHCKGYYALTFVQTMTYGNLTYDQVRMVTQASTACHYVINLRCSKALMSDNGWKDYFGVQKLIPNTGGTLSGHECQNYHTLTNYSGTITEIDKFPITVTLWGDTDNDGEELYYRIEPLVCIGVKNQGTTGIEYVRQKAFNLQDENMKFVSGGKDVKLHSCTLNACSMQCVEECCSFFQFSLETCACQIFNTTCACQLFNTTGTKVSDSNFNIYYIE